MAGIDCAPAVRGDLERLRDEIARGYRNLGEGEDDARTQANERVIALGKAIEREMEGRAGWEPWPDLLPGLHLLRCRGAEVWIEETPPGPSRILAIFYGGAAQRRQLLAAALAGQGASSG